MLDTIPDVLARIVATKRQETAPDTDTLRRWKVEAEQARAGRRDFRLALVSRAPAIIAEIKKASPSRGLLAADFDPARIARRYESGGAAALSVLTDTPFFQGSLSDLKTARGACGVPVLRKDFTLNECHVLEAAAGGSDAILLIAAILDVAEIRSLREAAASHGMAALVEVHDELELAKALDAGAELIGVNNRDLSTFQVTIETSLRLGPQIPAGVIKVSESGIHSMVNIQDLRAAGFQAFLVGERLMKSPDPATALRELRGA